jgi:hypothetical protein
VLGVVELIGQDTEIGTGSGCGVGGDQGQRKREPGAPGDDLLDGVGFGGDPFTAEAAGQQFPRLVAGEQVEVMGWAPVAAIRLGS